MDKLSRNELVTLCRERGVQEYSGRSKEYLLNLLNQHAVQAVQTVPLTQNPSFIEVCSGCGGLSTGFMNVGWDAKLLNEIIPVFSKTLQTNHPGILVETKDMQKLDLTKYHGQIDVLMGGVPCFVKDTLVLTNTGYKEIQDVTLDHTLMTHTGKFQKILNLQQKQYSSTLYDIKIKYHPLPISATDEHPFYVRKRTKVYNKETRNYDNQFGKPDWKKAKDLTMDDYYGMVINTSSVIPEFTIKKVINQTVSEDIHMKLDQADQWFMMGYFVGDGWVEDQKKPDGRSCHTVKFSVSFKDEEVIGKRLQKVLPVVDKKADSGLCKKYGCHSLVWWTILKKFGKYAHGKVIPEWVQDAPIDLIHEFINGYMAADGYKKSDGVHKITTVSHSLAFGLQRLYLKLGYIFSVEKTIRPKTCVIQGRTVNQRDTYQVRGHLKPCRFSSFIDGNYVWYAPTSITTREVQDEPVYNFEVEEDNSYTVFNTIVHNCQAFSQAGLREGLNDPRGQLMLDFNRLVVQVSPKILMIENVEGLVSHNDGKSLKSILELFSNNGAYKMHHKVLNAGKYEVPQKRKRIFIVGVRDDIHREKGEFTYPEPSSNTVLLRDVLPGCPPSDGAKYPEAKKKIMELVPEGGCWVDLPEDIQRTYMGGSYESGGGKRGMARRLSMNEQCLTLTTSPAQKQTERCHPLETRPLTVREYARIQTFPDSYVFEGSTANQYKQIGNAVPVKLAEAMGRQIKKYLA